MAVFIALLRGINVVGRKMVAMAELRKLFDEIGLGPAQSLLQSGNVVFKCVNASPRELEDTLERAAHRRFDLEVDCLVRSADQLQATIRHNPFLRQAKSDPSHLLVFFLRKAPKPQAADALTAAIIGRERVSVRGNTAYVVYPDGVGRSKLTSNLVERKLNTRGTARNWNTVLKLKSIAEKM